MNQKKCLYCGKTLRTENEWEMNWHTGCVRKFFGTSTFPVIDISKEKIDELAVEAVGKHLTVAGVQKKLSMHLSQEERPRLTIVNYPTGFILKPQTEEYSYLPEFEQLSMNMAKAAGIATVPHALVRVQNQYAYITKRIDRIIEGKKVHKFAMEDFCQLSNRLTMDKYKGSYEGCARIIDKYSARPGFDKTELFMRVLFSFLTGNSDMHLKNFSLIEEEPGKRNFCLSQAYDMLPVNLVLPEDEDQMALTVNGKKRNIRKKDFLEFALHSGINESAAKKMMKKMCGMQQMFFDLCDSAYLPDERKKQMKELIRERVAVCK